MEPAVSKTLPQMFEACVAQFGGNALMLEKRAGAYQSATYLEMRNLVHQCAAGMLSLGLAKGDRVALLSEGRNDWVTADLGGLYAGAINVPLSVKIEELGELRFRLAHSGCRMAIASGTQAHKILQVRDSLPELEKIILLDGQDSADRRTISFATLLEEGREFLRQQPEAFEERWQSIAPSDPANICYTSGTTADPKGIVLTHRNYTANVAQAYAVLDFPPTFRTLMILPWDHSFGHTVIYLLMRRGASIASVQQGKTAMETLKNIAVNIREIQPSILLSVPSLAKNFRKNIEKGIRDKGPRAEKLFRKALDAAYEYHRDGWSRGQGASWLRRLQLRIYEHLIFRRIREGFGGRLEFFIGGGALLDIELQKFYYALGMPMYQGYGLTEAAPAISVNIPQRHKLGSSGTPVPNLSVRICDEQGVDQPVGRQGEIVVRGENVMAGYWRNEKATRETLRDGWLHTGDIGYLDADGFLFVLGREKSLLIGPDGEKYSPEGIEEAVVAHSAFVDQMVLHNNQSQYTVALLVPNRGAINAWLESQGLSCGTEAGQNGALALLEREIAAYRSGGMFAGLFPERWLPAAIAILDEGFTEQNRMLNSTLKVVRGRIEELYRDRIAYLYTPEGKAIGNPLNRAALASLAKK